MSPGDGGRGRRRLGRAAPLALLAWLAPPALLGCGHHPLAGRELQRGRYALAEPEDVPVCGHDATVEVAGPGEGGAGGATLVGELLAATPEEVVLLDGRGVHRVQAGAVRRVLVQVRPGHGGRSAGLATLGAVSTVSNGVFLVFTFPLWLLSGVTAVAAGARGDVASAPAGHPDLPAYARFPQGLPAGWPPAGARPARCHPSPTAGAPAPMVDPASPPPPARATPAPGAPSASPLPGSEGS